MTSPLNTQQRNAYDYLVGMFGDLGLQTLAPAILKMIQDGKSEDAITYELQNTPEYKQRFAANEKRKKAGLPVLSPREYLETESAYRQVMQAAGMPKGFYDDHSDFEKWLELDVSPAEVKERSDLAAAKASSIDDATKEFMAREYGLGAGDLAAYFLDPQRALPELQKANRAFTVGGSAERQGLDITRDRAEHLSTSNQAANADFLYGAVAGNTREGDRLSNIYGGTYNQAMAEDEAFFGSESAKRARRRLEDLEKNSFSGSGGNRSGSLAQANQY